uniref:Inorganic phosphate cotransporter n=1 Tax=Glossina morsitans morsitans TaxID=37546 RepID=A0A1B0G5S7_GLOMM
MTQLNADYASYEYWDSRIKSLILSSFFWGYVLAQLPASMLARRFGGKIILGGATAASAAITMFHPLAVVKAHCGFTWGFYTLLTEVPTYLNSALNLDMKSNALLSALPYFVMWILCLILSPIADLLIRYDITSVTVSRKLFNSIGQWIPMMCLIALGYINQTAITLPVVLLTVAIGFNAASFCGYLVNHMDLSPNFAGPLMGITNGISNLLSIFAPLVAGVVIHNEEDPEEWRKVFLITATVYFLCNLLFVVFGKASVQPWNYKLRNVASTSTNNSSTLTSISTIAYENNLTSSTPG